MPPTKSLTPRSPRVAGQPTELSYVPLRLVAASGGLGIELYELQSFGPLRVEGLLWQLPGLAFPVDLSGGVRAFRNRRGELRQARLTLNLSEFSRYAERQLKASFGGLLERPSTWTSAGGIGLGLLAADGALAFELLWAPDAGHARFIVAEARSVGSASGRFDGPAIGYALAAVDTLFAGIGAKRKGRVVTLRQALRVFAQTFLPPIGVRVPGTEDMSFGAIAAQEEGPSVEATASPSSFSPAARVVRSLENAKLTEAADEFLVRMDFESARPLYLEALERAPRDPELCHTVAALDVAYAERSGAALGLLVESLPATSFGPVGAALLAATGDMDGARVAISRAASEERFSPLASLLWVQLSELESDVQEQLDALDRALAASARCLLARQRRLKLRLATGDVYGALADAEHLEAEARGAVNKHAALVQSAAALLEFGFVVPAGTLYERALRYLPKDAKATLGVARALLGTGRAERVVPLLERAIELSTDEEVRGGALVELAKVLASEFRDHPHAIARVREVSGRGALAIEARALEARWRNAIGDVAGSAVAYDRLRDAVQMAAQFDTLEATRALSEGARFFEQTAGDRASAERMAAAALRLSPQDSAVQDNYRRLAGLALKEAQDKSMPEKSKVLESAPETELSEKERESRAEGLKAQLLAAPTSAGDLMPELLEHLRALGRLEELYVLLWAQYEDADRGTQQQLRPSLLQLLSELTQLGEDQAELYGPALEVLEAAQK